MMPWLIWKCPIQVDPLGKVTNDDQFLRMVSFDAKYIMRKIVDVVIVPRKGVHLRRPKEFENMDHLKQ